MARVNKCDFVVALGGGSVMDCGKCIALMVRNEGDIWDYSLSRLGGKKAPKYPAIPIIAITTSVGTGSEVDKAAVISDDDINEKTGIFFPSMFPSISVVDSDLMMSITPRYTAYQGMDALFHATESMINKNEHMMGEMFALKAIELISQYLPIAYKDGTNKEARANMLLISALVGLALAILGVIFIKQIVIITTGVYGGVLAGQSIAALAVVSGVLGQYAIPAVAAVICVVFQFLTTKNYKLDRGGDRIKRY